MCNKRRHIHSIQFNVLYSPQAFTLFSPDPDFTSGPFVTRHDPVHQLIETISGLFLDSEQENNQHVILASGVSHLENTVVEMKGEIKERIKHLTTTVQDLARQDAQAKAARCYQKNATIM